MPDSKRNLTLFSPSLAIGGYERVVVNLANCFAARGTNVEILLCREEGFFLSNVNKSVSISELNTMQLPGPTLINHLPALASRLRSDPPDIFYTGMNHVNVISLLAWRLAGEPCPIVVSEHNPPQSLEGMKNTVLSAAARRLYSRADAVVAASEFVATDLAEHIGLPEHEIDTIYNPVVSETIKERASQQPPCDWFCEGKSILSVGRLHPQKDYPTLLEAFAKVQPRYENLQLAIIGTGPSKTKIESKIASLGLNESVKLLGRVDDPYCYMGHADVFVLSSRWEGFGNVLVEALACGCPVVSTDCPGGPAEILAGGDHGKLVPVGDPEALSRAIELVLSGASIAGSPTARAAQFSTTAAVNKYKQLFQDISEHPTAQ